MDNTHTMIERASVLSSEATSDKICIPPYRSTSVRCGHARTGTLPRIAAWRRQFGGSREVRGELRDQKPRMAKMVRKHGKSKIRRNLSCPYQSQITWPREFPYLLPQLLHFLAGRIALLLELLLGLQVSKSTTRTHLSNSSS